MPATGDHVGQEVARDHATGHTGRRAQRRTQEAGTSALHRRRLWRGGILWLLGRILRLLTTPSLATPWASRGLGRLLTAATEQTPQETATGLGGLLCLLHHLPRLGQL